MNSGKIKFLGDVIKNNGEEQNASKILYEDISYIWGYIYSWLLQNGDRAIEALTNGNNYFNINAIEPTLKRPLILTTDMTKAGIYKNYIVFAVNASTLEKVLTTHHYVDDRKLKAEIYDQAKMLKVK